MSWVPALVTGGLAFLAAVVTAVLSWAGQRRADRKNQDRDDQLAATARGLAELNDRLSREAAEESARRAYEYEARQRLYVQIQPLLFQLGELCESSYERIANLQHARVFRSLEARGSYVMLSTIHRLVSPLVVIRQIQRRLTAVDLGVDSIVRGQYLVAKEIARTLTSGQQLAETEPQLGYRWTSDADRQHVSVGALEMLITLLTVKETDGTRWMDYAELEAAYHSGGLAERLIDQIQIPLLGANPLTKPVVWRTLVAQAYLQWAMTGMIEGALARPASWEPPDAAAVFNWATRETPLPPAADAKSARSAALNYVTARLRKKLDSITPANGQLSSARVVVHVEEFRILFRRPPGCWRTPGCRQRHRVGSGDLFMRLARHVLDESGFPERLLGARGDPDTGPRGNGHTVVPAPGPAQHDVITFADAHRRLPPYASRRSAAHLVSWCRVDSCSLRSTDDTCDSTVFTEMNSSRAISLYV